MIKYVRCHSFVLHFILQNLFIFRKQGKLTSFWPKLITLLQNSIQSRYKTNQGNWNIFRHMGHKGWYNNVSTYNQCMSNHNVPTSSFSCENNRCVLNLTICNKSLEYLGIWIWRGDTQNMSTTKNVIRYVIYSSQKFTWLPSFNIAKYYVCYVY